MSPGEAELGDLKLSEMLAGLGESRKKLGSARKALERLEQRGTPVAAPLPGPIKERAQRKAAYESTAGEVTKWQSMVKVNLCLHQNCKPSMSAAFSALFVVCNFLCCLHS